MELRDMQDAINDVPQVPKKRTGERPETHSREHPEKNRRERRAAEAMSRKKVRR